MKAKPQYVEGPQAVTNFEQFATAVMQAPKPTTKSNPRKTVKPKSSDKN
jgi:hypothetical protein